MLNQTMYQLGAVRSGIPSFSPPRFSSTAISSAARLKSKPFVVRRGTLKLVFVTRACAGKSHAFCVGKSCNFVQYAAFFGHSASLAGDADRQDDLLLRVLPPGVRGDPGVADEGEIVLQGIQK